MKIMVLLRGASVLVWAKDASGKFRLLGFGAGPSNVCRWLASEQVFRYLLEGPSGDSSHYFWFRGATPQESPSLNPEATAVEVSCPIAGSDGKDPCKHPQNKPQ